MHTCTTRQNPRSSVLTGNGRRLRLAFSRLDLHDCAGFLSANERLGATGPFSTALEQTTHRAPFPTCGVRWLVEQAVHNCHLCRGVLQSVKERASLSFLHSHKDGHFSFHCWSVSGVSSLHVADVLWLFLNINYTALAVVLFLAECLTPRLRS